MKHRRTFCGVSRCRPDRVDAPCTAINSKTEHGLCNGAAAGPCRAQLQRGLRIFRAIENPQRIATTYITDGVIGGAKGSAGTSGWRVLRPELLPLLHII